MRSVYDGARTHCRVRCLNKLRTLSGAIVRMSVADCCDTGTLSFVSENQRFEMRFRLRSSERDESTDARRLSSIERSVLSAMSEAETERKGLRQRLDTARGRASLLLGNETFGNLDREPKSEQLLLEAERDLMAGERRIHQLSAHQEHLRKVLDLLKAEITSS